MSVRLRYTTPTEIWTAWSKDGYNSLIKDKNLVSSSSCSSSFVHSHSCTCSKPPTSYRCAPYNCSQTANWFDILYVKDLIDEFYVLDFSQDCEVLLRYLFYTLSSSFSFFFMGYFIACARSFLRAVIDVRVSDRLIWLSGNCWKLVTGLKL